MKKKNFNFNKYFFLIKEKISSNKFLIENLQKLKKDILNCKKKRKKVIIFGNGGSAAIASHFANDLSNIVKSQSIPEIEHALKGAEQKQQLMKQQEQQAQQEMLDKQLQAQAQEKQAERDFQMQEKEKDRQTDLLEAQIKSAGYGAMQDQNKNEQSDYIDALREIRASEEYQGRMAQQEQMNMNNQMATREKANIKREELSVKREIANKQLEIARENKNKYDVKSTEKKKK